jgi:hypothetical protein
MASARSMETGRRSTYTFANIDNVATRLEMIINQTQEIYVSSIYLVVNLVSDQFSIERCIEVAAKALRCKGQNEIFFLDEIS